MSLAKKAAKVCMRHSKEEADYVDKAPSPKKRRCEICEYWQDPNRCKIVRGDISPGGGCKYYESR